MFQTQKQQKTRKVSPRKEAGEVDRLRRSFERKLESRLKRFFVKTMRDISKDVARESSAIDSRKISDPLGQILLPHYREVITTFAQRVLTNLDIKQDFETIVRRYIAERGGRNITNISSYLMEKVNTAISDEIGKGTGYVGAAKAVEELGVEFSRRRSAVIARTETHNASGFSHHEMHQEYMPPNSTKRWLATSDGRTRSIHAAANGQEVSMDEDFIVGGQNMAYAGDYRGGPENVINCRCTIIYLAPEDEAIDSEQIEATTETEQEQATPVEFTARKLSEITFSQPKDARKALAARMAANALDPRHPSTTRFRGLTPKDFGRVSNFDDEIATVLEPCLEDCDELAKLFNVPPLRGVRAIRGKRLNANMGDGIMGINKKNMAKRGRFDNPAEFSGGLSVNSWTPDFKNWKESKQFRSWSTSEHLSSGFERFRNTVYHEFGHHIHQMYKVKLKDWDSTIGKGYWGMYKPPIEQRLAKIKGRKSPSVYGDTNWAEWFAENFASWASGNRQLLDPQFEELIEELIKDAYN